MSEAAVARAEDPQALGLSRAELDEVADYLSDEYEGVFDQASRDWHLSAHVGFEFARYAVEVVRISNPDVRRVFDIGAGFGSFVLCAREQGWDARGVEIAELEVAMARRRLRRLYPDEDPDRVFICGDATALAPCDGSYDAVTLWNVIEHVQDYEAVLARAWKLLRPGGLLHIICPSYLAWRAEAHYQVPWYPWMAFTPRARIGDYLRRLGKDPRFFEQAIFRRTNWGVQRALRRAGFEVFDLSGSLPLSLHGRHVLLQLRHARQMLNLLNPLRAAVELAGRKYDD